jgi:hypothetical protein
MTNDSPYKLSPITRYLKRSIVHSIRVCTPFKLKMKNEKRKMKNRSCVLRTFLLKPSAFLKSAPIPGFFPFPLVYLIRIPGKVIPNIYYYSPACSLMYCFKSSDNRKFIRSSSFLISSITNGFTFPFAKV